MPEEPKKETPPAAKKPAPLPMFNPVNERELLEDELQEMFDEDKVVHRHGNAEPESD